MKKQCKNCGSSVEHFNIDYVEGLIRCFYCNHTLPTEIFFNDVTVNKFSKKIPELRRDEFLAKLGFEKKPVRISGIIIGFLIALIPLFNALRSFLEEKDDPIELIFGMLPLLIVLVPVINILYQGTGAKYVKKKGSSPK